MGNIDENKKIPSWVMKSSQLYVNTSKQRSYDVFP